VDEEQHEHRNGEQCKTKLHSLRRLAAPRFTALATCSAVD
jgi:hypothetical protein